jgi:hypothetical protein
MSVEHFKEPRELPSPEVVLMYLNRLNDLTKLKGLVERGLFPVENYEGIPLTPDTYNPHGLMYGVNHAIFGTRNMLGDWGVLEEADKIIRLNKERKQST